MLMTLVCLEEAHVLEKFTKALIAANSEIGQEINVDKIKYGAWLCLENADVYLICEKISWYITNLVGEELQYIPEATNLTVLYCQCCALPLLVENSTRDRQTDRQTD
jgi:hypothetical protein